MISAGHIERASESEPSDYENCSSTDDRLGNAILSMQYAVVDFVKNVVSLRHTMAIESDG